MASTAPRAKAEAAGAAPTVEAARADDAARVATADLRAERQKRLPSPWTPELPPPSAAALAATDAVRDDDVALDPEEASTQRAARVLRATAELCGAPPSVSIAALVYLVVFYARPEHAHASDAWADVVPACLLLASKIEEKPTRVSDVVNAMQRVMHPLRRDPAFLRTEAANGDDWSILRAREKTSATEKTSVVGNASNGDTSNVEPGPNARVGPECSKTEPPRDPASRERSGSPTARTDLALDAAAKSKFLREEIARLKKKYPALLPKSLYASAVARWEAKTRTDMSGRDAKERASEKKEASEASDAEVAPKSRLLGVGTERDGAAAAREKGAGSEQPFANETEKRAAAGRVESLVAETTETKKVSEKILGTPRRDEDDPNFRASRPVVGDAYYERKARVLCAEQKVLRAVDAEVNVPRVASALLNVARAVRAPKAVAKLALVALTDLLFATASPSRLARGLFFGAPSEEPSETTTVGDETSRGVTKKKTAILAARAPLDLAGDASAAAVRLAARLCGYALRRDDKGGAPIWTRAAETREDERKRKRSDSEIQTDDERSNAAAVAATRDLDPWWVEMEFDHARVERIERDALDVLTRGARRGVARGASEAKTKSTLK